MSRGAAGEARLQAKCVQWLWNTYPETRGCFLLIDNNATSAIGTLQKRAMGMVKGAADTMFFWRGDLYFFEFKIRNNKQSEAQKNFEKIALIHAKNYSVIYTFENFCEAIKSILRP